MAQRPTCSPGLRAAALTLLAASVLAGCGSSGSADSTDASASPPTPSPTTASAPVATTSPAASSTSPAPAPEGNATDRCHTSELTGSITNPDAGAGQRSATLVLTNTGGETCTIQGYGGVGLVDAAGTVLPSSQERRTSPAPTSVQLAPGEAASSTLGWTAIASGDEPETGSCEPTPAELTVIPPDETDPLEVAWTYGPVCGGGQLEQTAYAG